MLFSELLHWTCSLFYATQAPFSTPPSTTKPITTNNYMSGILPPNGTKRLSISLRSPNRNSTAPLLGGLLYEDISHSGDGGLYGELLYNRAFQGSGVKVGYGSHGQGVGGMPYGSIIHADNPSLPFGPVLDGWTAVDPKGVGVKLSLDLLHPLSDALPTALQLDIPLSAADADAARDEREVRVGVQNSGFWGIPVQAGETYNISFHAQASGVRFNYTLTHFHAELRSTLPEHRDPTTGEQRIWCSTTIPINNHLSPYRPHKFTGQITCPTNINARGANNSFTLTVNAQQAAGQTLFLTLFSLFPAHTYNHRPNGLRADLAQNLQSLHAKFLRFPGGNQIEGLSYATRWRWFNTIGPLSSRKGRPGDWGYYNTDGLGLLEMLMWCEDMRLEPLLAVYAGFSLDLAVWDWGNSTTANEAGTEEEMQEVLEEALGMLEYATGDAESTYWGAVRAEHGREKPFQVKMLEVGNEDWFSHRYDWRAKYLYEGLRERYPDMTFVFSALDESKEFAVQIPSGGIWDAHVYAPASWFTRNHDFWTTFPSTPRHLHPPVNHPSPPSPSRPHYSGPAPSTENVVGSLLEYHVSHIGGGEAKEPDGSDDGHRVNRHPTIGAAVAEAVFAIGGERASNVYKLACFAPMVQRWEVWRGTPYLLLFLSGVCEDDDEQVCVVRSASYWREWVFNRFRGRETLAVFERAGGGEGGGGGNGDDDVVDGEDGIYGGGRDSWDGTGMNPLYWVASIDTVTTTYINNNATTSSHGNDVIYFKIANAGNSTQLVKLDIDSAISSANGTMLAPPKGRETDMLAHNYFDTPKAARVEPRGVEGLRWVVLGRGKGKRTEVEWTVPAFSVAVLQFDLPGRYPLVDDVVLEEGLDEEEVQESGEPTLAEPPDEW